MKARLMKHEGKAAITVPAEVSSYFDTGLMDYVQQEISPAKKIVYDLPADSKFGGYPVGKDVLVPVHMQKPLYEKGFKFARKEDEVAYLAERTRIDAEIKRREDAAKVADVAAAEAKTEDAPAEVPPSGNLVVGGTEVTPEPTPEVKKLRRSAPLESTEGGSI